MSRNPKRRVPTYSSPYEADLKSLTALLARDGLAIPKKSETEAVAWLPSAGDRPLPSSALIDPDAAAPAECTLEPWMVRAISLTAGNAETLLAVCAAKEMGGEKVLEPGAAIGEDLFFWAGAFRFAGALVTRQQFLPDLISDGDSFAARWTPVIAGADRKRLRELAQSMPAVARALADEAANPPERPAESVVTEFVAWVVDALVRQPGTVLKRGGFDSLHDQWLHALRFGDGGMTGSLAEIESLARQVAEWRRPIQVAAAADYRLCLQMEEPPDQGDQWAVRYLLAGRARSQPAGARGGSMARQRQRVARQAGTRDSGIVAGLAGSGLRHLSADRDEFAGADAGGVRARHQRRVRIPYHSRHCPGTERIRSAAAFLVDTAGRGAAAHCAGVREESGDVGQGPG